MSSSDRAASLAALKEKYTKAGQEHVFTFFDTLSEGEQDHLLEQLSTINPSHINDIVQRSLHASDTNSGPNIVKPLPDFTLASKLDSSTDDINKWYASGLDLISQNKVAVVLMAGGQGTRLGSSDPKGCYDIGLPSHKSLFQLQAERIRKIQELASQKAGASAGSVVVPWYIMTSCRTREPTQEYFEGKKYFGLNAADIKIFEQGLLPCISNEGKIMLETKGQVAVSPNGNGGIYEALISDGVLDDMRKRGIQYVHVHGVDNCLVKVADPVFIGFSAALDVDIATKVVRKRDATECVGLIVTRNGRPGVVEYSEIDEATAHAEDPKHPGVLKFRAANIVNHCYSLNFLGSIPEWADKLPHHIARKKIPTIDLETGEVTKPESPNGIKLEQFIFDVFPEVSVDKFACLEVLREDEFSPLKNARGKGQDDPDTSRRDVMAQGARWVEQAGATAVPKGGVEVSALLSYVRIPFLFHESTYS